MPRIAALGTERTAPVSTDRIPIEPAAGGGAQYIQYGNLAGAAAVNRGTGRYYWVGAGFTALSTLVGAINRVYYVPYIVFGNETLDRLAVEVTAGQASTTVRLGIYNSGGGYPSSLLLDAGTVDSSTSGNKTITISQALTPGTYYIAYVSQGGSTQPTVRSLQTPSLNSLYFSSATESDIFTGTRYSWLQNSITGALPNPAVPALLNGDSPCLIARRSA